MSCVGCCVAIICMIGCTDKLALGVAAAVIKYFVLVYFADGIYVWHVCRLKL